MLTGSTYNTNHLNILEHSHLHQLRTHCIVVRSKSLRHTHKRQTMSARPRPSPLPQRHDRPPDIPSFPLDNPPSPTRRCLFLLFPLPFPYRYKSKGACTVILASEPAPSNRPLSAPCGADWSAGAWFLSVTILAGRLARAGLVYWRCLS